MRCASSSCNRSQASIIGTRFFLWPKELLETELNRNALASTVQHDLFDGNPDGWNAYVAHIKKKVRWFGIGLPEVKGNVLPGRVGSVAGKTTPVEPKDPVVSPAERDLRNEKKGWPWPEPRSTS